MSQQLIAIDPNSLITETMSFTQFLQMLEDNTGKGGLVEAYKPKMSRSQTAQNDDATPSSKAQKTA